MGKFFAPAPRSIAELATIFVETLDGIAATKNDISNALSETVFKAAAYSMGVEIEGEVTTESIGLAMGKKIKTETGIDLGNVLDGESAKVKLERVAIAALLLELKVDAPATRGGLAMALGVVIRKEVKDSAIAGDAAALIGDVGSKSEVAMLLAAIKDRDKTPKAGAYYENLRLRQKKYRQTHRRIRA